MNTLFGIPVIDSNSDTPIDIQLGDLSAYIKVEVICTHENGDKDIHFTTLDKLFDGSFVAEMRANK
jgi:hypothetical protein